MMEDEEFAPGFEMTIDGSLLKDVPNQERGQFILDELSNIIEETLDTLKDHDESALLESWELKISGQFKRLEE